MAQLKWTGTGLLLLIISIAAISSASTSVKPSTKTDKPSIIAASSNSEDESIVKSCGDKDMACLIRASEDRQGLEAITQLHQQLDDDQNGAVDLAESKDFLKQELKYERGAEKRQRGFHLENDMFISVKELWEAWIKSEVHNWTVEQTAEWLSGNVELPQYVPSFIVKRVTGAHLPRLATGNGQYITNVLGIKDPIHKQKIMLKAMDVVLFGPPKVESVSYAKDTVLVSLLVIAITGGFYAYRKHLNSKQHLLKMMQDMESLQSAEIELKNLQKNLEEFNQEKENAANERQNLEKVLDDQNNVEDDGITMTQLREEVDTLRNALQRAEGELVDRCWSPPPGLQLWLQLTHEIENKTYTVKKTTAEKQLQAARDACEKLRRKRSSLVGAFVSTHGKSIDDVDRSIVNARSAMFEVTHELAEKMHRWKQIEALCGFSIVNNKGLAFLENILHKNSVIGRNLEHRGLLENHDKLEAADSAESAYSVAGEHL